MIPFSHSSFFDERILIGSIIPKVIYSIMYSIQSEYHVFTVL